MLLDTNALIWLLFDDARLGLISRGLISDAERVHYSSVSVAEITIKHMLGRTPLPGGDAFPEVFRSSGLVELPLGTAHAAALRGFDGLVRHDPFDRLLLAQAAQERLTFLTSDATMLTLDEDWIRDAQQ